MVNEDIKEILKNGSKAKLLQLAVELREFVAEGLENPTLSKEEVQAVRDKAKKEGWDGELFRVTYKVRDMEAQVLATKGVIFEAIYYLQEFGKDLQRIEILLDMLHRDYIKGYNDKTEKYEDILNRTPKEMEGDINKVKDVVLDTLEDITWTKILIQYGNDLIDKGERKETKITREEMFNFLFKEYKQLINNGKIGFYLTVKTEFGGYRLYKKEQFREIKLAFVSKHLATVGNIVSSLDHLDYLLELIEEYKPELLELIRKDDMIFIPSRDKIKEFRDYLETYILPPLRKEDKKGFYTEEYLLNDLTPEIVALVKKTSDKLEEYIRYGK